MRLLVLSDTHLGRPGWNGFGDNVLAQAKKMACASTPNVVLFCGDLIEPDRGSGISLSDGLRWLGNLPADRRLWIAGNNDIQCIFGSIPILEYPHALQELAIRYGIHLLDFEPCVVDGVAFVGNFGFFDLSLWRKSAIPESKFPSDFDALFQKADNWHRKELGIGINDLFLFCQNRLRNHLIQVGKEQSIVVTTHTVPTSDMVLYGHSSQFDLQNASMGWDDTKSSHPIYETPGLVLQLCGHTHRSKRINRLGIAPLINVSGNDQPFIFDL